MSLATCEVTALQKLPDELMLTDCFMVLPAAALRVCGPACSLPLAACVDLLAARAAWSHLKAQSTAC